MAGFVHEPMLHKLHGFEMKYSSESEARKLIVCLKSVRSFLFKYLSIGGMCLQIMIMYKILCKME